MQSKRILIVGAGIAGLAMYRALRLQGLDADMIEREAGWSTAGSGIGLPANSVDGMFKLGLGEKLLARAHRIDELEYALADGETLALNSLLEPPLNKHPFVALSRRELIEIMCEGVSAVRFTTTIADMTNTSQGVDVVFSSGGDEHYDLVIAADGIHSATRNLAFPEARLHSFGMTNWRFIIERDTCDIHPVYYLGKDDAFMIYPISDHQVYCYAHTVDPAAAYISKDPITLLREKFGHYAPEVASAIAAVERSEDVTPGRIESVEVDSASTGRVILVGDALHGCPPTLQQGTGQAIADALTLSRLLAKGSVDEAISAFQAQRQPEFGWVVRESNKIMKLGKMGKFALARILRNRKVRREGPLNVVGWRQMMNIFYS